MKRTRDGGVPMLGHLGHSETHGPERVEVLELAQEQGPEETHVSQQDDACEYGMVTSGLASASQPMVLRRAFALRAAR